MRTAHGNAAKVPKTIAALEVDAQSKEGGGCWHQRWLADEEHPWGEVYGTLYHQLSITSAGLAAVPHLVEIAQRYRRHEVDVFLWVGDMEAQGGGWDKMPDRVLSGYEAARERLRLESLRIFDEVSRTRFGVSWCIPLVQAFCGLRHRGHPLLFGLELIDGDIFLGCSRCGYDLRVAGKG